ncbi:hypothetical protein F2Q69_00058794 [Brassica cretica]|uniref:Uncharacterized protein n=1 Tax=Brassica cretica TaxID=69181 RepID=A0A8S9RCC1_BRACR|nr:hypothetical protein F2Q69_00058794 [Brassica cretica]
MRSAETHRAVYLEISFLQLLLLHHLPEIIFIYSWCVGYCFYCKALVVVFIYPTTNRVVSISHTVEISVDRFVVGSVGRCSLSSSLLRLSVDRWQACHVERWCIPIPRGMM